MQSFENIAEMAYSIHVFSFVGASILGLNDENASVRTTDEVHPEIIAAINQTVAKLKVVIRHQPRHYLRQYVPDVVQSHFLRLGRIVQTSKLRVESLLNILSQVLAKPRLLTLFVHLPSVPWSGLHQRYSCDLVLSIPHHTARTPLLPMNGCFSTTCLGGAVRGVGARMACDLVNGSQFRGGAAQERAVDPLKRIWRRL